MSITIATSLYPAAANYFADWVTSVTRASRGRCDVSVVIALDGVVDAGPLMSGLRSQLPLTTLAAESGASIAAVRQTMLAAAIASGADNVVFCDSDDALTDDALALHEANLVKADISFGDLLLTDAALRPLGRSMFGGLLPIALRADDLTTSNVLGFSNTAIRRDLLVRAMMPCTHIPDAILAVDWWFYDRLLALGASAERTSGAVAFYRQHNANTLGSAHATDLRQARSKLAMFAAQMRHGEPHHRREGLLDSTIRLAENGAALAKVLSIARPTSLAWFADVTAWLEAAAALEPT